MIGIYKITSPTNKLYIGQSTNIENRWSGYYKLNCKGQHKLFNSLSKHGVDKHQFDVIELCDEDKLIERETYWKEYYQVMDTPSLCCRIDGKGGRDSIDTKNKKRDAKLGITRPQSFSDKIKTHPTRNQLISDRLKGVIFSDERNLRLSNSKSIPVYQLDLNGVFIKEWSSAKEAAKLLKNKVNGSDIRACINGAQKTAYGFIWILKP